MPEKDDVLNQPPPLRDYNVFLSDRALVEALAGDIETASFETLSQLGAIAGSAEAQNWARLANTYPPVLHTHDRYGRRIDDVEYHPAYHELMRVAARFGLHAAPWASSDAARHLTRAAGFYVWGQVEAGHGCPVSMTYAAVPALRANAKLAREWEPLFEDRETFALCGMAMTEKQGGSDVRANITRAVFAEATAQGDAYLLSGHKWFCSAPMSDAFLILAQADEGLTCFFMPRMLPDDSRNRMFIQRLKDKLGNRSNASSEIELDAAWAIRIGEPGKGVQTIVEMVNFTRLDCINGSAACMRAAVTQAVHHAQHRSAFGKLLADQPLMQNVLADLAIESEAALLLLMRLARAVDRADANPQEALLKRLGTALGKYYVCKRAPAVVAEALECLGGNGYVEDSGMPRLFRESPLNSIWEGSGNINALDVLRILGRQPEAMAAFRAEIEPALDDARIASAASQLFALLPQAGEHDARTIAERMAQLWQAALFARVPHNRAAEAFIESRVARRHGATFGTLAGSTDLQAVVERAGPLQSVEYTQR
jgi:putative acyl-CoA dehydrogenase